MCIDLATPEGHDAFCKLLATADVLVHNLAPKAARKLKLTREDCREINPGLVYCHIRGYAAGPQEDDLASNPVAEASSGVMEANRIDGRPSRLGPSYHDQFAGAYAVIGVLAAMLQYQEGEETRPVEVGLYETGLHVASRDLSGAQLKMQLLGRPEREPNGEFGMPGYGAYHQRRPLDLPVDAHRRPLAQVLPRPEPPSGRRPRARKPARAQEGARARGRCRESRHGGAHIRGSHCAPPSRGVGFTEVLPLERVLDAPQARQPGKLRQVHYRGLAFDVPEFPRLDATTDGIETLPPPELASTRWSCCVPQG